MAINPSRKAHLKAPHPKRRFAVEVFDNQSITSKTEKGNTKFLGIVDTFKRFFWVVPISDEAEKTIVKTLVTDWISNSGAMNRFLSDRGLNLTENVVENLAETLGNKWLIIYPMHPQANATVEPWNRTL